MRYKYCADHQKKASPHLRRVLIMPINDGEVCDTDKPNMHFHLMQGGEVDDAN